jgi:hypothetical protein
VVKEVIGQRIYLPKGNLLNHEQINYVNYGVAVKRPKRRPRLPK